MAILNTFLLLLGWLPGWPGIHLFYSYALYFFPVTTSGRAVKKSKRAARVGIGHLAWHDSSNKGIKDSHDHQWSSSGALWWRTDQHQSTIWKVRIWISSLRLPSWGLFNCFDPHHICSTNLATSQQLWNCQPNWFFFFRSDKTFYRKMRQQSMSKEKGRVLQALSAALPARKIGNQMLKDNCLLPHLLELPTGIGEPSTPPQQP